MGGKIDCYIDSVSAYSQFAIVHLLRQRDVLASHGVEIEFHPVFLGGINVGSGNQPPWTLPAKGKYLNYDRGRACKYFGVRRDKTPKFFPYLSIVPMRAMLFIKDTYDRDTYETVFLSLFTGTWNEHIDISKAEGLRELLGRKFESSKQVDEIMQATARQEYKDRLKDQTKMLVDKGAFGCPWMFVTNSQGKVEPFFGSDRFHFMWEYLGLPWEDVRIKPKGEVKL